MHGRLMILSCRDLVRTIRSVTVVVSSFIAAVFSDTTVFMAVITMRSRLISQITTPSSTAEKPRKPYFMRSRRLCGPARLQGVHQKS